MTESAADINVGTKPEQGCSCSCHNPVMSGLFCEHCAPDGRPGYKPQGLEDLPPMLQDFKTVLQAKGFNPTNDLLDMLGGVVDHYSQAELTKARLDERKHMALDNYRGQTFSDVTNYRGKFDKFIENNERRIDTLTAQLKEKE